LVTERGAGHANGRKDGAQRDSGSALNVVIEGEHLIAVTIQNGTRVNSGEVFPLKKCGGKNLLDGGNEGVNEAIVIGTRDARVPPAEILGIAKAFLIICADVQNDGQSPRGMNSADQRVERKFSDGDAESTNALITDAEDALAIGDDDDVNFRIWVVPQERGNRMAKGIGNEKAARTAIDVAEFLAAKRDDGRIDDGQHFFNVTEEQTVEEHLIGVLKLAEIDMALKIVRLEREGLIGADGLIIERFDDGRKKAVEAKSLALV